MDDTSIAPLPDWVIPPHDGFTADDFLQLSGLPRHTELIDGSLIFASPRERWHRRVISLLHHELDRQSPAKLGADREMAVRLGKRQVPEPDVVVVTTDVDNHSEPSTCYCADDVVLAVEAVSPDSEIRDRDTKPRKYAAAEIRHFWRVENDGGKTVVYVYERDPATGTYSLTGIHRNRLVLSTPFDLDIDLSAIDLRR